MNRDQAKGSIKDMAGKVQRKIGGAAASTEQRIKGTAKQVEGKVQKAIGNMREDTEKRKQP